VLQFWNPATQTVVNTHQAAEEFVCTDQLIAFRTSEALQNKNLESGSGPPPVPSAFVLQAWDTARPECIVTTPAPPAACLHNSQDAVTPCALDACDPRLPYRIAGRQVKFLSFECDQRGTVTAGCASGGTDLNGDTPPDADDLVLRIFDLGTGITTTVGT